MANRIYPDVEEIFLLCCHTPCPKGLSFGIDKEGDRNKQILEAVRGHGYYKVTDQTFHCSDHTTVVPRPLGKK